MSRRTEFGAIRFNRRSMIAHPRMSARGLATPKSFTEPQDGMPDRLRAERLGFSTQIVGLSYQAKNEPYYKHSMGTDK